MNANEIGSILAGIVAIALGVVGFEGARRRWSWLVDPPSRMWPFNAYSAIKKLFGEEAVILVCYLSSGFVIAIGIGIIISAAINIFSHAQ